MTHFRKTNKLQYQRCMLAQIKTRIIVQVRAYMAAGSRTIVFCPATSGGIAVDGALKEASSNGYVDVLTAADITGTVEVPEGYACCIVESPEGSKTVRIRRKKGLVFVIK